MEYNVNEPGYEEEEGIYREKKDDEEEELVPVQYLSFVQKRRRERTIRFFFGVLLAFVIFGIAPSQKKQDYCPRCGRWQAHNTLAWGRWDIVGMETVDTEWTEWYESLDSGFHHHHWVPAGKIYPGMFIFLTTPIAADLGWMAPENLVERMRELDSIRYFRPGRVIEIPRILGMVNTGREWNAIIGPLTVGTTQDASDWWQANREELVEWSERPFPIPLFEEFMEASESYVEEMRQSDYTEIQLEY